MNSIKEVIKNRRSVRTFDGKGLSPAHLEMLEQYDQNLSNPFGVNVEFRFFDAAKAEQKLTSPVLVGERLYFAVKSKKEANFEAACGYEFEKACIYAASLGIGTVILAGTFNREEFEKAMEVQADEVMPVVSPIGYPASKMSLRETMMRKGVKADERMAFEEVFFDGFYGIKLTKEKADRYADAFEMVRLAPSAVNKQPWRLIKDGNNIHFYEKQTTKENALGDIQKIDLGIAMAHFELAAAEDGIQGQFVIAEPELDVPEGVYYIATYKAENCSDLQDTGGILDEQVSAFV